jgi:hypothetical protein
MQFESYIRSTKLYFEENDGQLWQIPPKTRQMAVQQPSDQSVQLSDQVTRGAKRSSTVAFEESKEYKTSHTVSREEDVFERCPDGSEKHRKVTTSMTNQQIITERRRVEYTTMVNTYVSESTTKIASIVEHLGPTSPINMKRRVAVQTKLHGEYLKLPMSELLRSAYDAIVSIQATAYGNLKPPLEIQIRNRTPEITRSLNSFYALNNLYLAFQKYDMSTTVFDDTKYLSIIFGTLYPEVVHYLFGQMSAEVKDDLIDQSPNVFGQLNWLGSPHKPADLQIYKSSINSVLHLLTNKSPISFLSLIASNLCTEKILAGVDQNTFDLQMWYDPANNRKFQIHSDPGWASTLGSFPVITTVADMETNPRKYKLHLPSFDGYNMEFVNNREGHMLELLVETGLMTSLRISDYKKRAEDKAKSDPDFVYFSNPNMQIENIIENERDAIRSIQKRGGMLTGYSDPRCQSFSDKHQPFREYIGDRISEQVFREQSDV